MSRILLVDENEVNGQALQNTLSRVGHELSYAQDAKSAFSLLRQKIFDLVICDLGKGEVDGIEVSRYIKANHSIPVILLTDFAGLLEDHQLRALGADACLAKPVQEEALLKEISAVLKQGARKEKTPATEWEHGFETDYAKLLIDEFRSPKMADYAAFLQLSPRKFLKIAHRAGDLSQKRLDELRAKGVEFLYLRGEDFRRFLGAPFDIKPAGSPLDAARKERRIDLLRHTAEIFVDQLCKEGLDPELYEGSANFVHSTINLLADSTEMLDLLTVLRNHADNLFGHGVGVSVYSVMMAKALGWNSSTDALNIAVGGLLHDVGLRDFGAGILTKPREQWSASEAQNYELHSARGAEMLSRSRAMPEVVIRIVREHHEDCEGKGFPSRMAKLQIHPMSKLVSVANEFCHRVLRHPQSASMTPQEAIVEIESTILKKLDPIYFNILKQLVRKSDDL